MNPELWHRIGGDTEIWSKSHMSTLKKQKKVFPSLLRAMFFSEMFLSPESSHLCGLRVTEALPGTTDKLTSIPRNDLILS